MRTIYTYMAICGGTGLVPLPQMDQVLVGGLLARMIQELGAIYHVRLSDHRAKLIVSAVLGGAHTRWISHYVLGYVDAYLPDLQGSARLLTRPVVSAATAYAVGMLFFHHFDQGAWRQGGCTFEPKGDSLPLTQAPETNS